MDGGDSRRQSSGVRPPESPPTDASLPAEEAAQARAEERRQARDAQLAGLLDDLPDAEAQELRGLLGSLEERPERLPGGDAEALHEAPADTSGGGSPGGPGRKDHVARGLLIASVVTFLCAVLYGWAVGRSLPPSLRAHKTWVERGVLPGGAAPAPGQTVAAELRDPWKEPYRLVYRGSATWRIYSCGPNRRDEAGQGDDLVVPGGWRWLRNVLLIYGEGMLGILGLVLVWLGAGLRVLWLPRSRDPRVESARAIGLLLVPAILSWLAARVFGQEFVALLPQRFVLSSDIVLWGSIAAVLGLGFFLVKGWRRANLPLA